MSRLFSRKFDSYRVRDEEKIDYKRKVFIAFEGVDTEPKYFEKINKFLNSQNKYTVELFTVNRLKDDGKSHPKHVRDGIIEFYEEIKEHFLKKKDRLCIIIDIDKHFGETEDIVAENFKAYLESLSTSDGTKIYPYVSNPCFELWLILQFEEAEKLDLEKIAENKKTTKTSYIKKEYNRLNLKYNDISIIEAINNARSNSISALLENNIDELYYKIGTNLNDLFDYILGDIE